MENPFYLLKNMIINISKTGIPIFDYIINFLLLSFITYIFQNKEYIKKYILKLTDYFFYKSKYVEIIIEAQNNVIDRGNIKINKLNYSKIFQAITYYIKELKPKDVYSKIEPDKDKYDKENKYAFDIFIPNQNKSFILDNYKKIECITQIYEDYDFLDENKKNVKKSHTIKIFSKNDNTTMNDLEEFIERCVNIYNKYLIDKVNKNIYYFCYNYSEDNGELLNYSEKSFITHKTFSSIFFEDKDKYMNGLNFFLNNKDWYIKKGIPYHYGILLHGHPGCGKTSIIKATLEYTKRNAFVIPLNRVNTCGELINIFYQVEINGKSIPMDKRIYIFEDFDCLCDIINDRETEYIEPQKKIKNDFEILSNFDNIIIKENNIPSDKLTLSCLLNIFDGILETPGRIIILTSNFPERIDKALLRPGRIDLNIELKKASSLIIKEILSFFYDKDIENLKEISFKDYMITPATVMNICLNNINNIDNTIYNINYTINKSINNSINKSINN